MTVAIKLKQPTFRLGYVNEEESMSYYYTNPSLKNGRTNKLKVFVWIIVIYGFGFASGSVLGIGVFIRVAGGTGQPSIPISASTLAITPVTLSTSDEKPQYPVTQFITPSSTKPAILEIAPTSTIRLSASNANRQAVIATETTKQSPSPLGPTATIQSNAAISTISATDPPEPVLFRIVSEESVVSFAVDETLPLGTAIGRTNQVAGDILVDFNEPHNSQLGIIRVNLRTLKTDRLDRDYSIRCCVLLTAQDAYEFTDFVPTLISNLPDQIRIGQVIPFQITGNLTLRGITQTVTFDISLTVVSDTELRGIATAIINRSNFGILNNGENNFNKHGVAETVTITFEFIAKQVS